MQIEIIRIKCIKDFYMESGDKTYSEGQKYVFVKNGDKFIGFDDEYDSIHKMDLVDFEECFDLDNIEEYDISDFVLGKTW